MSAPLSLPATLPEAHALIEQLQWRVGQLEKELYGPSSERQVDERLSKEQILLSLFPPPAEPAATQQVLVRVQEKDAEARPRRQPAAKVLETLTERMEPAETVCPHCGKTKCEIGCEKSERFEYVPAKVIRHEILRPKLIGKAISYQFLRPKLIGKAISYQLGWTRRVAADGRRSCKHTRLVDMGAADDRCAATHDYQKTQKPISHEKRKTISIPKLGRRKFAV